MKEQLLTVKKNEKYTGNLKPKRTDKRSEKIISKKQNLSVCLSRYLFEKELIAKRSD